MDGWFLIGIVVFAWFVFAPIFGVLGFSKANRLERELQALRRGQATGAGFSSDPADHPVRAPQKTPVQPSPPSDPMPAPIAAPPKVTAIPARTAPAGPAPSLETARQSATPPKPTKPRRSSGDWEQLIAANWMIWVGGLTVAIGGLLLVRFVWEAGLLNDVARVGLGGIFGICLVLAGLYASKSALVLKGSGATGYLPSILVAGGITVLNGAVFAAGALYGLVPPLVALASYVLVALFAVALSLRFGRWVAALGLIGAYFGPIFTGADGGSVSLLLAYAAGVTGGALALIRLRGWSQLVFIGLIGAGFWGFAGVGDIGAPAFVLPVYALTLAGFGLVFGVKAAARLLGLTLGWPNHMFTALMRVHASLGAAYLFVLLAGGLLWLNLFNGYRLESLIGLGVFALASLGVAWWKAGYRLLAPIGSTLVIASLLIWPGGADTLRLAVLVIGAGYALLGGWLALNPARGQAKSPELAAAAALTPPGALFVPVSGLFAGITGFWWGYLALLLAAGFVGVLEAIKRENNGFEGVEKTAAAFALGALLSAVLAPFAFLQGLWLGSALAVLALGICLIYTRFPLAILKLCGPLAVAGAIGLLMRPWLLDDMHISPVPIFNELLFGYGIAILALGLGAWWTKGTKRLYEASLGGALILTFALFGLEIRHFAQGGNLYADGVSLSEMSGYAVTYLGMAASLAWQVSARGRLFKLAEHISALFGALAVLFAVFLLPSEPALGVPVLNLLLVAFAMPALLMAGYASVLRRQDRADEAGFWGWGAIVAGFIWITLETRRMFVGADVLSGSAEGGVWAYSIAWLAYAILLLVWGTLRKRKSARFASLGVLILAVGKVFVFDLALLEGVVRAFSFIGLGACLIAIALFYQRYVFGRDGPSNKGSDEGLALPD